MRTVRSSSRHGGVSTPPGSRHPPKQVPPLGVGLETPRVWAWRPPPGKIHLAFPLGCGPGYPPGQDPPQLSPWLWAWRTSPQPDPPQLPPWVWALRLPWPDPPQLPIWLWAWRTNHPAPPPSQIPLNFPPGCGPGNLQGMLGYHPPDPPVDRQTSVKT